MHETERREVHPSGSNRVQREQSSIHFGRYCYRWDKLFCALSRVFAPLVSTETSGLRDTGTNANDLSILVGHGERLLDIVIRLETESEWEGWMAVSLR